MTPKQPKPSVITKDDDLLLDYTLYPLKVERQKGKSWFDSIKGVLLQQSNRIEELEAVLESIRNSKPIGDTAYKYGYAWEFCVAKAEEVLS